MSGVIFKVIPCMLLLYFSLGLMLKIHRTTMKRKMLLRKSSSTCSKRQGNNPDRTSALLLAIVLVFLIAELPQGIIAILNAVYTTHVHIYIYFNLGDILDLLSLLNSSITFILYCIMSSRLKYRDTFWTVVLPKHFRRHFFKETLGMFAAETPSAHMPLQHVATNSSNSIKLLELAVFLS
ncbi:unnamed protein product [Gongylonema pulchrum]|uniref:G_PROTEIN_RECEP_F1_2 domain-containing protein n=1 Tax=Gongylonema pulchrum TaxID=637853 RepID=A0A183DNN5_9BILA|nr:unnamed protein product [Gongylonema pulchrum]